MKKNFVFLLLLVPAACILLSYSKVQAQDLVIVEAFKAIPMSEEEIVYKDYYISGGSESGLKEDQTITVYRTRTIKDPKTNQPIAELKIPVGILKVISSQSKVAVAREVKLASPEKVPLHEHWGFMIGDKVELKTEKNL